MAQDSTPKTPTVRTPSAEYEKMEPRWALIDTLLGGTEAMRAAGRTYLPQYDAESNHAYSVRLARTVLLNRTESTLEDLSARPFEQELTLGEDVPTEIEALAENIDRCGTNLHAFSQRWFRDGWRAGLSYLLVDYTAPGDLPEGQVRTRADDLREGRRPFWQLVRAENVIAAYTEVDAEGMEAYVHVRILETSVERDGWTERVVERVRVLEPGTYAVWEPKDPSKKDSEWHVVEEGVTGIGFVPLVPFFAGVREGTMSCKPPLTDLADLNVAHWQSSSDQRNVLTVARFPILAGSGVSGSDDIKIGPNQYLSTESADGKWYYVEHTGAAIEAGAADLKDLEEKMGEYGAQYLREQPGDQSATARALNSAEGASYLKSTGLQFKDCLELGLLYTARYLSGDAETGGSVVLALDGPETVGEAGDNDALLKMRAQRDISRVALLAEMKARGVLSEDFDPDEDAERLKDEGDQGMGDMFGRGNGTGGGQDPADPAGQQPPKEPVPQPGDDE